MSRPQGLGPALVLAAGRGERLGEVKALARIGDRSLLERNLTALRDAGFDPVLVVTGHHPAAVEAEALALGARPVRNPDPDQGMLSSLRVGLAALEPGVPGVLVQPVDHGGVSPATLAALAETVARSPGQIVVPSWRGRRGHPTWFPASVFPELTSGELADGARTVLRRDPSRVRHLEVEDPWVVRDIDRPEDLAALRRAS